MQITRTERIMPGVTLNYIGTDKFKTGCMSFSFITELTRESAPLTALLPRVLVRGCEEFPDIESIETELSELYGARVMPTLRKRGEVHSCGLYSDFICDKYAGADEGIMERCAKLLGKLLLSPLTENGKFREDYTVLERKILVDDIRAGINDKRGYAMDRLLEVMCEDERYGIGRLGRQEDAESITPKLLTEYYSRLCAGARLEVFYCGAHGLDRVLNAVRGALSVLPERHDTELPVTQVISDVRSEKPKRVTEALDVTQGKLTVGFRLGADIDYAALMMLNAVYGGTVTSKLFANVRERLSLCYYAGSSVDKHKRVMAVSSGVEIEKSEEALGEIFRQLEEIKSGNLSDFELDSARRALVTAVLAAMDKPSGLEDLYFDKSIAPNAPDPSELVGLLRQVTKSEVIDAARTVKADTVYFLTAKGDGI